MICTRCAHWNEDDDHRCKKCAARLSDRQVESAFRSHGSLALQPELRESAVAVMDAPPAAEPVRAEAPTSTPARVPRFVTAMQQSLFSLREAGKVVSIAGPEDSRSAVRKQTPATQKRRTATASYLPQQGVLEFVPTQAAPTKKLATSVDARIYCEYPVASVAHRVFASLYDLGFIGILIAAFAGIISWGCDDLAASLADPVTVAILGAGGVLIGLLYQAIFFAVRGTTPGMRFAGLRLVDFDGRETSQEQMHMRIMGGFFSVLPAGLGLMWALVDEENLTWQDHISHTFPTPVSTR